MKKVLLGFVLLFPASLFSMELYQELAAGYYGDAGITLGLRLEDSSSAAPFFLQGRIGYIYQKEPGNAEDARMIFINNNQGGSIQEFGRSYLFALDVGWKWMKTESMQVELVASGLLNHYEAHFAFIGNNEVFAVKSTPFGVGIGANLRMTLPQSRSFFLVKCGVEYFPKTQIEAHGTYYYTPDGKDDKPRKDYTYEDADNAINQPHWRPFVLIGILYPIG